MIVLAQIALDTHEAKHELRIELHDGAAVHYVDDAEVTAETFDRVMRMWGLVAQRPKIGGVPYWVSP